MSLSTTDKKLLMALKKGRHFKNNPGNVRVLCKSFSPDMEWQDSDAAGRRLLADGLVKSVQNVDAAGVLHLRLTDTGLREAEKACDEFHEPTFYEKLTRIPFGKAGWDIFKIGFGVGLGVLATKWFGN